MDLLYLNAEYYLGFKGGTSLIFFYDLPRFSVDLDFNLINTDKVDFVYDKVHTVLLKHGIISDESKEFFVQFWFLDCGVD